MSALKWGVIFGRETKIIITAHHIRILHTASPFQRSMYLLKVWKTAGNCKDESVVKTLRHGKHPLLLLMALGSRDWAAHSPFGSAWTIPVPDQLVGAEISICLFYPLHCSAVPSLLPKVFETGQEAACVRKNYSLVNGLMEEVQLWLSEHQGPGGCSSLSCWQLGPPWYAQPNMVTVISFLSKKSVHWHCVALAT